MPFPPSLRVIYARNPLKQVICQLRFPPILRITSGAPAGFQEMIRAEYPLLREQPANVDLLPDMPAELAKIFNVTVRTGQTAYDFLSRDEIWTVGLTNEFLSLSTTRYERWEDFRGHLEVPFSSLIGEYRPTFFSRIGLRYQDVIRRSQLGPDNIAWNELLQPHIAGPLCSGDIVDDIEGTQNEVLIRLPESRGRVRLRHGLAVDSDTKEICYLIDSDFHTQEKTEIEEAYDVLDGFKQQAARLFRWSITDRLHEAMGPEQIAD